MWFFVSCFLFYPGFPFLPLARGIIVFIALSRQILSNQFSVTSFNICLSYPSIWSSTVQKLTKSKNPKIFGKEVDFDHFHAPLYVCFTRVSQRMSLLQECPQKRHILRQYWRMVTKCKFQLWDHRYSHWTADSKSYINPIRHQKKYSLIYVSSQKRLISEYPILVVNSLRTIYWPIIIRWHYPLSFE